MYDLNPINLRQVNLNFINTKRLNHNLTFKTMFGRSEINSELKFQGKSLIDISSWKSGELNIFDHDKKDHNINLNANVLNGNLEYLNLKFNSNLHQLFALNNPVKGKTDLLGEILINKICLKITVSLDTTNLRCCKKNIFWSLKVKKMID